MQFVQVQEITITGPIKYKGSNRVSWNYDLDGKPFGQVFTFRARGEVHQFQAVTAAGRHLGFFMNRDYADEAIRGEM